MIFNVLLDELVGRLQMAFFVATIVSKVTSSGCPETNEAVVTFIFSALLKQQDGLQ